MTDEQLREVIYQCAGAATAPLMEDHPDYVFPDQRVGEAVASCLASHSLSHLAYPPREEGDA